MSDNNNYNLKYIQKKEMCLLLPKLGDLLIWIANKTVLRKVNYKKVSSQYCWSYEIGDKAESRLSITVA